MNFNLYLYKKVVDLDRKRNHNREALGKLKKDKNLKDGTFYLFILYYKIFFKYLYIINKKFL